jgi:hypothetical protein
MKPSIKVTIATSILLIFGLVALGQEKPKQQKETPLGTPVLWQEPSDIATRNLFFGPGGEAMKPTLTKVTVIEEKESTDAAKFRVRDGAGREWVVKAGGEAQAEVAASRIVWAVGYYTDVSYIVPSVEIEGKGIFQNARFEARLKGVKRLDEWLWDDNAFNGTRELQGLKVLLALLDNWNLKNENNKILFVRNDEARSSELLYTVSDFDTKFDKNGTSPGLWHATNQAANTKFIDNVNANIINFGYSGKHKERLAGITADQAKWIGGLLGRLSAQQLRDALRAGNYSSDKIQVLEKSLRTRIDELLSLK